MRRGKVDRQVLGQSVLLDDGDQHLLIESMLSAHHQSAAKYRSRCSVLLLAQIGIVVFFQFYVNHSSIRLFALFLSLAMLFTLVYGVRNILLFASVTNWLERLIKVANLGVSVLMLREFSFEPVQRSFCVLPMVNLIVVWFYEDYITVGTKVSDLEGITYKYKSV